MRTHSKRNKTPQASRGIHNAESRDKDAKNIYGIMSYTMYAIRQEFRKIVCIGSMRKVERKRKFTKESKYFVLKPIGIDTMSGKTQDQYSAKNK